jgi:hypothetical protein
MISNKQKFETKTSHSFTSINWTLLRIRALKILQNRLMKYLLERIYINIPKY